MLQECGWYVVYPSGKDRAITYLMEKYGGLDKHQVADMFKIKSRWIALYNRYPAPVLVYDGGAHLTTAAPEPPSRLDRKASEEPEHDPAPKMKRR